MVMNLRFAPECADLPRLPGQRSYRCVLQDKGDQTGCVENQQTVVSEKQAKVMAILLYILWFENNGSTM